MQSRKQKPGLILLFAMTLLSASLFSFSFSPGGDHFEVYLNKKLVFQQIVSQPGTLKTLALDQRNINDEVNVFYSHCGKIGNKRSISIKDGKNVLKQWRFSDVGENKFMALSAQDILAFQNKNLNRKLNLYYSSEEIPDGKLLASIILDTDVNKSIP